VFPPPVLKLLKTDLPIAVFEPPIVFPVNVLKPKAVFPLALVAAFCESVFTPKAVLSSILFPPLPAAIFVLISISSVVVICLDGEFVPIPTFQSRLTTIISVAELFWNLAAKESLPPVEL
jgi:hypothetical protein